MYKFLLVTLSFLFNIALTAQTTKTFAVNPGKKVTEEIPFTEIYRYPEFKPADILMKDGTLARTSVNYNSLYGEMQFIDPKGDTLSIADEKNIKWLAVEKDTFYFGDGWLELVGGTNMIKLAKKKILDITNKEKIGAMDVAGFGAIETNTKSTLSQQSRDLVAKERTTYTEHITYYFADRFNNFSRANKKGLLKIYGKQQEKIEQYLQENKIDFNKGDDIKKLYTFLLEL